MLKTYWNTKWATHQAIVEKGKKKYKSFEPNDINRYGWLEWREEKNETQIQDVYGIEFIKSTEYFDLNTGFLSELSLLQHKIGLID